MANNELAIRFTENYYATKSEVSKELKMSLIDNIWTNILNYRNFFNRQLTIKTVDNNYFNLCVCQSVSSKINELNSKLLRVTRDYMRLSPVSGDLAQFEDKCLSESLKPIAKINDIDVDDIYLRNLLHDELKDNSPSAQFLINYAGALKFIKKKCNSPIDIDFLAEVYSILTANPNLTSFYRTVDDKDPINKVLIDRVYTSAPAKNIEDMMNGLFGFIANSNLSAVVKAIVTYYYVNYIKPFPQYSDEVALLLSKAVLAHFDLNEFGACIPLEALISENAQQIARIFIEVQKSKDVTYFVNYGIKFVDKKCDEVLDLLAQREAYALKNDFYREETSVAEEQPSIEDTQTISFAEIQKEENSYLVSEQDETQSVYEDPAPAPSPVVEPVKQEPVVQQSKPIEVETPVRQEPARVVQRETVAVPKEEIAFSYIPPVLDEKAAYRLEEHLLELDPSMKRGEAHFYARHCTIGKRYTIQQYKKAIGCAYETARTSMDHLVAMGYYRKEMVKNKNVYTPIPRN